MVLLSHEILLQIFSFSSSLFSSSSSHCYVKIASSHLANTEQDRQFPRFVHHFVDRKSVFTLVAAVADVEIVKGQNDGGNYILPFDGLTKDRVATT